MNGSAPPSEKLSSNHVPGFIFCQAATLRPQPNERFARHAAALQEKSTKKHVLDPCHPQTHSDMYGYVAKFGLV